MGFGDSDLQYLLADMGVTVSVGSSSTKGLLDSADGEILAGAASGVLGKTIAVTVRTGVLSGLATGATATVASTSYKVRDVTQLDDGALTKFYCQLVQ